MTTSEENFIEATLEEFEEENPLWIKLLSVYSAHTKQSIQSKPLYVFYLTKDNKIVELHLQSYATSMYKVYDTSSDMLYRWNNYCSDNVILEDILLT